MKNLIFLFAWVGTFVLAGCAAPLQPNQALAIINSNPPGATISNESFSGIAPQERVYTLQPGQTSAQSGPITARWVSGATTTTKLNLTAGQEGRFTLQRPNVLGIEVDVQWAIQLQQQQNNDSGRAVAAALDGFGKSMQSNTLKADCTPKIGGGFSCY